MPDRLTSRGHQLDTSSACLGALRSSAEVAGDVSQLRHRMAEDGYLFLPGFLEVDAVLEARRSVTDRLLEAGLTDPSYPSDLAVARPGQAAGLKPDLAHDNPPLHRLLYTGPLLTFYEDLFGGPVRHYDYTWMRTVAPGLGTAPHGDVVFMGRGTHALCTAWVPLGDVDLDLGGLMVLEGSHRLSQVHRDYAHRDVDTYCENVDGERDFALESGWRWNGSISDNPAELREQLGGRWLTGEFRAGDLLTFSIYLLHASLDNRSDRLRLSSDSRYQPASQPADERWIGEAPAQHGPRAKKGLIC